MVEFLLEKGYEVHGLIRRSSSLNTQRINHLYKDPHDPESGLFLHYADLIDGAGLQEVLTRVQPNEVYSLGPQSHVRVSFDQPAYPHRSMQSAQYDCWRPFVILGWKCDSTKRPQARCMARPSKFHSKRARLSIHAALTHVPKSTASGRR